MTYFSHSKTKDGKIVGSKRLIDHIQGVQKKALHRLAAAATQFTQFNTHDLQKIIEIITLYHDLGKYTSYFQNYLLGSKAEMVLKQHAKLGGYAAYQFALAQDKERMALLTLLNQPF
ncbi:MAG: CRISPR-associated helicase Cas3 [Bacteroidota bacterium]|jgi:CRISPR-associated endonuclease/helicase Cas3